MSSAGQVTFELANNQKWVWAGQRLHPDLPIYNMAFTFVIDGEVQPAHLQKAFQALVDASDVFRTVVDDLNGTPRARVHPSLSWSMPYLDWSGKAEAALELDSWSLGRASVPLPIEQRMFDTALIRLARDRFAWYLNLHHLIGDGWSFALAYRQVAENYDRLLGGHWAPAEPLPQFWSWATSSSNGDADRRVEAPEAPDLSTAFSRFPIDRSLRERRRTVELGVERTRQLRMIAGSDEFRSLNEVLSLLHLFLAVVYAYLHRMSGGTRFVLGVPFHQRGSPQARVMIGPLQDTLPVAVDVAAADTFSDLIRKTMGAVLESQRDRSRGRTSGRQRPAYDVMVNLPNVSFPPFHGFPTRAHWAHPGYGDGTRLLFLQILDLNESGNFVLQFDFNDAIDPRQEERTVGNFLMLLEALVTRPSMPIQDVELASRVEMDRPSIPDTKQDPLNDWGEPATLDTLARAAKNEIERRVAEIWREVLRVDRVGRDDKFFEIGGHSLHLVEVHHRLRQTFGGDLPITELFRLPTVRALSAYLSERPSNVAQRSTVGKLMPSSEP